MPIFSDGFESGDFNAWNFHAGATVVSTEKHSGSYSMKVASGASGNCKKEISLTSLGFVRFFLLLTGQPAENQTATLILFGNAGSALSYFAYRDVAGTTQLYLNCGGDTDIAAAVLSDNVWHCVDAEYNDTTDIHNVWVDGTLKLQASHDFGMGADWFRLGVVSGLISQDVYIDDVLYNDSYSNPSSITLIRRTVRGRVV